MDKLSKEPLTCHEAYNIDVTKEQFQDFINYVKTTDGVGNVYADPPWEKTGVTKYKTMSDAQIKAMKVNDMFRLGYLFLWVTKGKLKVGLEVMKSWGFKYADFLIWLKVDENGNPLPAVGRYLSHAVEICLIGRKGTPEEIPRLQKLGKISDIVITQREKPQSAKPRIVHTIILELNPTERNVELFARDHNKHSFYIQIGIDMSKITGPPPKLRIGDNISLSNKISEAQIQLVQQAKEQKRKKKREKRPVGQSENL